MVVHINEIDEIIRKHNKDADKRLQDSLKPGSKIRKGRGGIIRSDIDIKKFSSSKPVHHKPFTTESDLGDDGQWIRIQEYLDGKIQLTKAQSVAIDYSILIAEKKARKLANYYLDGDDGIKLNIEPRFQASKRLFPTGCSKNDSQRFKCPKCNKEEIGVVKIKEIAKQMRISGYTKMSNAELYSIPEIKTEVLRRLRTKEFNIIITKQNPVSANEYGHCPICGKQVFANTKHTKGSLRKTRPINIFERKLTFIYPFDINDHVSISANFNVNKKSDGRGPTGWLDVDAFKTNEHRHTPGIVIKPRLIYRATTRTLRDKGIEKEIHVVTLGKPCECGSMTIIHDTRRSENVCSKCGLVIGKQKQIVDDFNQWKDLGIDINELGIEDGEVDRKEYITIQ